MRRRRNVRRKTSFKRPKRNSGNTGIYIIAALICMIGLNLVFMSFTLSKNIKANASYGDESFSNESNLDKLKTILKGVLNKDKNENKYPVQNQDNLIEEDQKTGHENVEDFIIIENLEEYENFIVVRDSTGKVDLADIPEPVNVKKVKVDPSKPYILAYHTHSNEAYQPMKKDINYTSDSSKNMLLIGDLISKVIENGGHKVIQDRTQHDIPSFNKSYSRSLNTIKSQMAKEENIKFLFDIHRDGMSIKEKGEKEYFAKVEELRKKFSTTIDGKSVATFSLVVGPDSANYEEVLSYAKYIKAVSDTMYPGLCKGIIIKKYGRFNQYLSDYSALLEVGAQVNTIDQSTETAKLLGEIIDVVISKLTL